MEFREVCFKGDLPPEWRFPHTAFAEASLLMAISCHNEACYIFVVFPQRLNVCKLIAIQLREFVHSYNVVRSKTSAHTHNVFIKAQSSVACVQMNAVSEDSPHAADELRSDSSE